MEFEGITALIDRLSAGPGGPILPAVLVVVGISLVALALSWRSRPGRSGRWPRRSRWQAFRRGPMANPANQIEAVSRVQFECRPLLIKSQARWLFVIEEVADSIGNLRVMAQVSLDEALKPVHGPGREARRKARTAIHAKRLDFGLFDETGMLVLALEYAGLYDDKWRLARAAVKREVLARANVPLIEIDPDMDEEALQEQMLRILFPEALDTAAE